MHEDIFKDENIKNSEIFYEGEISQSSRTSYCFLLAMIIGLISALPFIKLDIITSSPAFIETALTNEIVVSTADGKVSNINFKDNLRVKPGDTLIWIDNTTSNQTLDLLKKQKKVLTDNLYDVKLFNSIKSLNIRPNFRTKKYQIEFDQVLLEQKEIMQRYNKVLKNFDRSKILFNKQIISLNEWESEKLKVESIASELDLLIETIKVKNISHENILEQDINDLTKQINQLEETSNNSVITANISGTIYKNGGIQPGSFLQRGQQIAEITPTSSLIAVCYISPKDIGLIYVDQSIMLQVDAFNYLDWGVITGKVAEINDAVSIIEGKPYFIVKCILNKTFLELKNGKKGIIKKGMTSKANFKLTERSLWQLIFDKTHNWLDPSFSHS